MFRPLHPFFSHKLFASPTFGYTPKMVLLDLEKQNHPRQAVYMGEGQFLNHVLIWFPLALNTAPQFLKPYVLDKTHFVGLSCLW